MENPDTAYGKAISDIFNRFPSFQRVGGAAYKPGIDGMLSWDRAAGHPHSRYLTVHVAGTNGKGSVSHMIASSLAAAGYRTGLYTSPHLLDFRERMKICDGSSACAEYISREEVMAFIGRWKEYFDANSLSFFEITTMMAFEWFASSGVDVAVIETGLGGRLDSTNIITPVLSVITNIGLDHCDMLGTTRPQIAFEKAGIIKQGVPAVIGEDDPEISGVFSEAASARHAPLYDAASMFPVSSSEVQALAEAMDLRGSYQPANVATSLAALSVLSSSGVLPHAPTPDQVRDGILHAASRMRFLGRWQTVRRGSDTVIADIGHNSHGLKYNFSQLEEMYASGRYSSLTLVLGFVSDKDTASALALLPRVPQMSLILTRAEGPRAMDPKVLYGHLMEACGDRVASGDIKVSLTSSVSEAAGQALRDDNALIYIGGSTFVVAEALPLLDPQLA